jgi:hypothetical protein
MEYFAQNSRQRKHKEAGEQTSGKLTKFSNNSSVKKETTINNQNPQFPLNQNKQNFFLNYYGSEISKMRDSEVSNKSSSKK